MTTREIKPAVLEAISEIRLAHRGHEVDVESDNSGGAHVTVGALSLGPVFEPSSSWVGFHITFQYPHSDIYPHYVIAGLKRSDGVALQAPFHPNGQVWQTPISSCPATMVSRKSNHWDPANDTACGKLLKVLEWIRSQ